jgi:hypothetical protein
MYSTTGNAETHCVLVMSISAEVIMHLLLSVVVIGFAFVVVLGALSVVSSLLFTTYNWRFILKSFIPSNTLGRRLMLASAGLLLCANGALAAEVVRDAQMQARDLLSGTVGGRPTIADVSSAIPTDDRPVLNLDPQEQARELILGKNFAGTVHQAASLDSKSDAMPVASVHRIRRVDIDGQELAQRLLLGTGV